MKYNLSTIMHRAWEIKREHENNIFAICLKMAWCEAKYDYKYKIYIKDWNKERFALKSRDEIVNGMKRLAKYLKGTCDHFTDTIAIEKIEKLADEYNQRFGTYNSSYYFDYNYTIEKYLGCRYPEKLVIFDKDYVTIEEIKLV